MKKSLLFAFIVLCPVVAQATVTINVTAARLYDQNGNPLPANSAVVLLADVQGDGFGDLTQALNSFKADADDIIVGGASRPSSFDPDDATTIPVDPYGFVFDSYVATLPEGAPLMLVWYNRPWLPIQNGPGSNVFFGTFTDPSWVVPADGNDVSLEFLTVATGLGSFPDSRALARFNTIIPEPSSALLAMAGCGLFAARRRRVA